MSAALVELRGTAHGTLALGGTLERTLVTGRVESQDLVLPTGAAATASADIGYDEESLGAPQFVLDTAGARVTGHARMGMVSSRLDGAFSAAIESLPALLAPLLEPGAPAPPVNGTLEVTGTIGGTTVVPDVPLRVQSTPLAYDTQALGTLEGEARLLGTELQIERLVLDQGPGQLRASGRVDYESYAYDADGRGAWADLDPSRAGRGRRGGHRRRHVRRQPAPSPFQGAPARCSSRPRAEWATSSAPPMCAGSS